jgi:hypothetical protein
VALDFVRSLLLALAKLLHVVRDDRSVSSGIHFGDDLYLWCSLVESGISFCCLFSESNVSNYSVVSPITCPSLYPKSQSQSVLHAMTSQPFKQWYIRRLLCHVPWKTRPVSMFVVYGSCLGWSSACKLLLCGPNCKTLGRDDIACFMQTWGFYCSNNRCIHQPLQPDCWLLYLRHCLSV